jgi:hypothetical protein
LQKETKTLRYFLASSFSKRRSAASPCPESGLSGQGRATLLLFEKEEARKSKNYVTIFLFLFVQKK